MDGKSSIQDRVSDIGLLGGSFDPVHFGHLALAQLALEHFSLKRVYFIPANIQPHKEYGPVADTNQRLEMLRLALKGNESFDIWDGEITRGGKSYTVDTVTEFFRLQGGRRPFFIIGSDNLNEVPSWKDYGDICSQSIVCAGNRPGYESLIPEELYGCDIRFFPGPGSSVSSSLVRERITQGYSCRYILPEGVWSFIKHNRLYRL